MRTKGGQREKGRTKEEREDKGRKGGQRKKGRTKEEREEKWRTEGDKGRPKWTWTKQYM